MTTPFQPSGRPRTVAIDERRGLDIQSLVLLAVLLAAGFILNFTAGKAISAVSGGAIAPEFIVSAFCLAILVIRPTIPQALVIGLISAAVIQITTSSPGIDFVAEGIAAVAMASIVNVGARMPARNLVPVVGTFTTTFLSGMIFMVIKMALMGFAGELAAVMTPVVTVTAVFNAILVGALYQPVKQSLGLNE
ncbi:hypothetical protein [Collinsella intestinalis]|uniref:hypothetical protein n=1 Tax=Collinsella intestinalis TaxID=147207 RepID=UPI002671A97C|nr:hypothetical protein [Collinsella intestinalis]